MAKKSFLFLTATALITSLLLGGCGPRPTLPVEKEPDFPTKPITVIVPFSAGGGSDLQVRALEKLAPNISSKILLFKIKPVAVAILLIMN